MSTFSERDMNCGHCKAAIAKSVSAANAQSQITIDLDHRTATIVRSSDNAVFLAPMKQAGYAATERDKSYLRLLLIAIHFLSLRSNTISSGAVMSSPT